MSLNGRLKASELSPIPGGRLARPYAVRWNLMCADCRRAGVPVPMPNGPYSSYRSLAGQRLMRAQWCSRGKCGNAAVPGTSNHGWGKAVDTNQKARAIKYGRKYGVRDPSDAPWEPWHTLIHLDPLPKRKVNLHATLRKGVVNRPSVRHLQETLRKLGSKGFEVNGKYDLATRRAVRRWQAKHGMKVDGVVSQHMWARLHKALK